MQNTTAALITLFFNFSQRGIPFVRLAYSHKLFVLMVAMVWQSFSWYMLSICSKLKDLEVVNRLVQSFLGLTVSNFHIKLPISGNMVEIY